MDSPAHLLNSERKEIRQGLKEKHEIITRQEELVRSKGQLGVFDQGLLKIGENYKFTKRIPVLGRLINNASLKKSDIDSNRRILQRQYEEFSVLARKLKTQPPQKAAA